MRFHNRVRVIAAMALCASLALAGVTMSTVHSQDRKLPVQNDAEVENANAVLQAVGGLGVGHIQSTLGLIGVTADAFAKDVYNGKQVEDLMNGTVNGIEHVKKLLRRLQEADLTDDDKEYVDRMINVYNALQREAKTLITFSKSRRPTDAEAFDVARKSVVNKLGQLTEGDRLTVDPEPESTEKD